MGSNPGYLLFFFLYRRYDDKSNANLDLDDFLVKAYAKQIKELNSSTGRPIIIYYLTKAYYKLTKNKAYLLYYNNSPFLKKKDTSHGILPCKKKSNIFHANIFFLLNSLAHIQCGHLIDFI